MMDSLLVVLDDVIAGTLERLPRGRLRFDYTDEYRDRTGATPISLSMPPQVRSHPDRVVTPWLWGLLPDNDAVQLPRVAGELAPPASQAPKLGE